MKTIEAIKPGPKPNKPDGTPDRRRRVTPEVKPKLPDLKPPNISRGIQNKFLFKILTSVGVFCFRIMLYKKLNPCEIFAIYKFRFVK